MNDVLEDANHANPPSTERSSYIDDFRCENVTGYKDEGTTSWYPQGITISSDAYNNGTYGVDDVIMTSWYEHTDVPNAQNKGERISFIDIMASKGIAHMHLYKQLAGIAVCVIVRLGNLNMF